MMMPHQNDWQNYFHSHSFICHSFASSSLEFLSHEIKKTCVEFVYTKMFLLLLLVLVLLLSSLVVVCSVCLPYFVVLNGVLHASLPPPSSKCDDVADAWYSDFRQQTFKVKLSEQTDPERKEDSSLVAHDCHMILRSECCCSRIQIKNTWHDFQQRNRTGETEGGEKYARKMNMHRLRFSANDPKAAWSTIFGCHRSTDFSQVPLKWRKGKRQKNKLKSNEKWYLIFMIDLGTHHAWTLGH